MGEITKIEWATHTASPWHGCSRVHAGCDNCYAEAMAKRNPGTLGIWGDEGTRVKSKTFAAKCRKWNAEAEAAGTIASVFPSICDPFEDRPELEPWRLEMFKVIDECPNLRFMLLTKRPENILRMTPVYSFHACETGDCPHDRQSECDSDESRKFRDNVWLLTSISDQATADAMIPELLKCRDLSPVLGVSAEPLLGPVDLTPWMPSTDGFVCQSDGSPMHVDDGAAQINWCIVGGESGPNARPCDVSWIRSLRDQCQEADVACFIKQLGASPTFQGPSLLAARATRPIQLLSEGSDPGLNDLYQLKLRDPKGGDWSEWEEDLRVREFPQVSPQ